jgi:hypothetical protein
MFRASFLRLRVSRLVLRFRTETAVAVKAAVMLRKMKVEFLMDDLQGQADARWRTVCFRRFRETRMQAYAGAYCRLRQATGAMLEACSYYSAGFSSRLGAIHSFAIRGNSHK